MARRRRTRRRRNPARIMVNPRRHRRRRRRNHGHALRRHRGHARMRRRRNPAGVGAFLMEFLKLSIPAVLVPGVVGFAQAKLMGGWSAPAQVGSKALLAVVGGFFTRKHPMVSISLMASIMGTIGFSQGIKFGGGVVADGPTSAAKQLAALVREDKKAMGVLVTSLKKMGAHLDDRVNLRGQEIASTALPGAVYQDVRLS